MAAENGKGTDKAEEEPEVAEGEPTPGETPEETPPEAEAPEQWSGWVPSLQDKYQPENLIG